MTRARGGRWSSGFWSGFVGTVLSPMAGAAKGFYGKLAANAVVAGTISQVTGGKFANGAWSGAFRFMFNEWAHDVANGIKKGAVDIYEGILSAPKAMYSYGDYLGRITGFRDWQNGNILPFNQIEANLEYEALKYGLVHHKVDIASSLWNDMKARPNYYISGALIGPAGGQISASLGRIMGATTVIKIPGAISDTIHTQINPLH